MFVVGVLVAALSLAGLGLAAPAPINGSAAAAMQASLQKQRESLQKQRDSLAQQPASKTPVVGISSDFVVAPIPPLVQADCPRLSANEVEELIASAAQKQSLQPALLRAVMRQESGFRPCAVSIKGAQGLMQLMPATATQFRVLDPFDAKQNVAAGAALLKQLLDRYKGDLRLALVAYNAGANRADDSTNQSYPAETQRYIANIFAELGIGPPERPMQAPETADPAAH